MRSEEISHAVETNKENNFFSPTCNITPTSRVTPTNGKNESVGKLLFNSHNINVNRNRKFTQPIVDTISPYNFNVDSSANSPTASPFSKRKPPLNASFSSPSIRSSNAYRNHSLIPVDNIQLKVRIQWL